MSEVLKLTKSQYKMLNAFLRENKFQYKKNGKFILVKCPKPEKTIHNWEILDRRIIQNIGNIEFRKNGKIDCILRNTSIQ